MGDVDTRDDYALANYLSTCFHSQAVTEEELNAFLLALLWEREKDPPLWAARLIDYKEKQRTVFTGFLNASYPDACLTEDERGAIWALAWCRRWGPEPLEGMEERWKLERDFAAYHRHPEIVARFRRLFPDIAWEEPPK